MLSRPALALTAVSALLPIQLLVQPAHAGTVAPLTTVQVASGLNRPVFATHAPGDTTRLFIVEQRGVIKILDLTNLTLLASPFLDIDSLVVGPTSSFDERGLLGLAFHPDYSTNGFFYVNYTRNGDSATVIARYHTPAGTPDDADETSAVIITQFLQPQDNHNGGWLGFGPNDGYLHVATGDGGNFCDIGTGHPAATGNAQDITGNLLGKVLRIEPSVGGGGGYSIPADNPFVGVTGDDEIWAYGLRNPWRPSFDRANGDLYIADVGQDNREEVNYQNSSSSGGENYGWRCFEGNACSSISGCRTTPCGCSTAGLTMPIHEYTHALGFSITGGYVYRGCDIPSLDGHYVFGDFGTTLTWTFKVVGGSVTEFTDRTLELDPGGQIGSISSFGEDAQGEIYIVERASITTGEIWKIIRETGLGDFDCNGFVGITDLFAMFGAWGVCPRVCPWDLDRDGLVGITDLFILFGNWGIVP